jgi:dTDP-4-amino-4,6-dideoxygalactose transaminase
LARTFWLTPPLDASGLQKYIRAVLEDQLRCSVPFLDLEPVHERVKAALLEEFEDLIDSGSFTNGPYVALFEQAFAAYCGSSLCVGVASGLDALRLGLAAEGVGPGDEVLVPAQTFIATFEAVSQVGALPVPVDVSEDDYTIDPALLHTAMSHRTRAIVPVHLYGQMANLRAIGRFAAEHDLVVIEDACQAHGASRDGIRSGAGGHAGAFSFYPGKNLGAFGDAGALITDDVEIARSVRRLREHGQREKYRHESIGYTARLDTIQALVLLRKLPYIHGWNAERRLVARYYGHTLKDVGDLVLAPVPHGSKPAWHLYVVRTERRDRLAEFLRTRGVETGFHYPEPPYVAPAYADLGYERGDFPVADALADEAISLPIYPGMSESRLEAVVSGVKEFFRRGG